MGMTSIHLLYFTKKNYVKVLTVQDCDLEFKGGNTKKHEYMNTRKERKTDMLPVIKIKGRIQ